MLRINLLSYRNETCELYHVQHGFESPESSVRCPAMHCCESRDRRPEDGNKIARTINYVFEKIVGGGS